jgi:pyruvate dehydrogenase E2 component (dihydrolipoamide acetyltransferase)
MGMYKIDSFVAILNPPQTGILAIGGIKKAPVVVDDRIEIRPLMSITLTYDHRVVDGALAAKFTAKVRDYLENPYLRLFSKDV